MRFDSQAVRLFVLAVAASAGFGCRDSNAGSSASSGLSPSTSASPSPGPPADFALPGIDISAMTPRERREWGLLVTTLFAPCATVPVPVSQCVTEKRACGLCVQAAKWVARAVRAGASDDQIQRAYKARFDPSGVKSIPVDGSPSKGPENAPVTLVEFADFECPHCREAVPLIDAVLAAHPGKVRLVYKAYTLPFHVHGEPAARAAFAAGNQGKFWEMEHALFERQQNLEMTDLERYAQMLKLDVARWKADLEVPDVTNRIAHDHGLGESLKLKGTPTLFINGRELDVEQDESLESRVAAELGEVVAEAAPAVAGDASSKSATSGSERL